MIIYSHHAKTRMRQRGITRLEVEYILKYAKEIRNSREQTKIAISKINNRQIKVVFVKKENYLKIITVI